MKPGEFPLGSAELLLGNPGALSGHQLTFHAQDLLREAVCMVPVVEVALLNVSISCDLHGGDILRSDRFAAEVTEFCSFHAHKPSFWIGLCQLKPIPRVKVAVGENVQKPGQDEALKAGIGGPGALPNCQKRYPGLSSQR